MYAKFLSVRGRSSESVCAWIAREMQLPIPEPVFLRVLKPQTPKNLLWPFGEAQEGEIFGLIGIPNALPLRTARRVPIELLANWKHLAAAAIFDELVMNSDRSESNLLFAAPADIYIIDHEQCLRDADLVDADSKLSTHLNFLMTELRKLPAGVRFELKNEISRRCAFLRSIIELVPYEQLLVPDELATRFAKTLKSRARVLDSLILSEIGIPMVGGMTSFRQ